MGLNHVALTVSDGERSETFYREHFGFSDVVHSDEHLLILSDGVGLLALSDAEEVPPKLPRTNHFGIQLADGDEVREARVRFRDAGIVESEWQDDGNFVRVQVFDPDGYQVELYSF
jgi:catechol 2,3-dioxygenase-like lactoylglutathione lyase family enzyme